MGIIFNFKSSNKRRFYGSDYSAYIPPKKAEENKILRDIFPQHQEGHV